MQNESFLAEVDRRKQQAIEAHRQKASEIRLGEIGSFYEDLKKYRELRMESYAIKLNLGNEILNKVQNRLRDLPEEAIAPNNISQLIKAADDLTENALQGMAELIGLEAVMEQLNGEEKSGN
jgi:hypothetical protein